MRIALLFAVLLAAGCGHPQRRLSTVSPEPHAAAPSKRDAGQAQPLENLARAEAAYENGLAEFEAGRSLNGRAQLRRAFQLLTAELEADGLPAALREDFLGMVEKVRTWEGSETPTPSALDVPEEELLAVPAAKASAQVRSHRIPIDPKNETTRKFIHIYTKQRPKSVEAALGRSGRYRKMMTTALRKAGLPEELFFLVMTESEYKMRARSRVGASGLWQFMPATGRHYGLKVSFWVDERYNPEKATRAAIKYLTHLHHWFDDWHLAIAAYNRGEYGIARDLRHTRSMDFGTVSKRGALPRETNLYVPKFMACVLIGESPERYGLHPEYETPTPYEVVPIKKPLSLKIAAKAAGITTDEIKDLNPELRAWATPKGAPYPLRIPQGAREKFLARLAKVKNWNPGPEFIRYKVRRGDFLGKIARRYRTTVKSIVAMNRIRNARLIRPGMVLKIRPGRSYGRSKTKRRKR